MTARTELTKSVSRRVHIAGHGDFVATLSPAGVSLRKLGRRGRIWLTWDELAREGLERIGVSLTEREWGDPLRSLERLATLRRLHGTKRKEPTE